MRITVGLVSSRPGGLDVVRTGLASQTFTDFELVFVDALYEQRKHLVTDYFAEKKISVRHTPPRERIWPWDACPQARNTVLGKARGEIVVWIVDYAWLPPTCLEQHWNAWEETEHERVGAGAHDYLFPPEPAYALPGYAPIKMFVPNAVHGETYSYDEAATDAFLSDLDAGFYHSYMLSIFATPIETASQINALKTDQFFYHADPKLTGQVGGKLSGSFFHAKNEGVRVDIACKINGFDESYIGHLYDDTDFGHRAERAGTPWILLRRDSTVQIVNPRHLFPSPRRRASTQALRDQYERVRNNNTAMVSQNQYSLGGMRTLCPWWY